MTAEVLLKDRNVQFHEKNCVFQTHVSQQGRSGNNRSKREEREGRIKSEVKKTYRKLKGG